mmetsp:Transcript_3855/g.8231  ORF Transcript_3855/g.8231 Transcript_3855/m.8231 type:complete len:245 (+) Transcript_3855:87-821(+)
MGASSKIRQRNSIMASLRQHQELDNTNISAATLVSGKGATAIADEETDAVGHCAIPRPKIAPQEDNAGKIIVHDSMNRSSNSSHSTTTMSTSISSKMSSMVDDSHRSMKRNVCFSNLEIRSYDITLGDSPTMRGPPISLGWKYDPKETETYEVDAYEQHRNPRRTKIELVMPPAYREDRMQDAGFSRFEMKQVMEEAQKVAKQRKKNMQTITNKRSLGLDEILGKANDTRAKIISKLGRRRSAD